MSCKCQFHQFHQEYEEKGKTKFKAQSAVAVLSQPNSREINQSESSELLFSPLAQSSRVILLFVFITKFFF